MPNDQLIYYLEQLDPAAACGAIEVRREEDGSQGYIYYNEGKICHCETEFLSEKNALMAMLAWQGAEILWHEGYRSDIENCSLDKDMAIFEFVQLKDELGSDEAVLEKAQSEGENATASIARPSKVLPNLKRYRLELRIVNPELDPLVFEFTEGVYVIGNSPECDIVVNHPSCSRRHAQIEVSQERILVRDIGSTNGTYVNNSLIDNLNVYPGDRIDFGNLVMMLDAKMARKLSRQTVSIKAPAPSGGGAITWESVDAPKDKKKNNNSLMGKLFSK